MKNLLIIATLLFVVLSASAQIPTPAPAQSESVLYVNCVAHVGNGKVIKNAAVGFVDGKFTFVQEGSSVSKSAFKKVIDLKGNHIYPGFINARTDLGLVETNAVLSTKDNAETGKFRPHVSTAKSYDAENMVIPTVRSNGILMSNVTGKGGVITNSSCLMQHDAWNWEDALVKDNVGIWLNWPQKYKWSWKQNKYEVNKDYEGNVNEIKKIFNNAKAYGNQASKTTNLILESMVPTLNGTKRTFVVANGAKEIMDAVNTLKDLGVANIVLVGANDAWKMTAFLKTNDIPVMLGPLKQLPNSQDEDLKIMAKRAKILQDAEILYCIYRSSFWDGRNLPFSAGIGVAYGLTKEEALMAITGSVAKILGVDDQVGTLEVGKDATFIITSGDPLDYLTHKMESAYIQGREINLDDHHKQLDAKYSQKHGQ
ncbi:MAG: amidohydrolase family protein [Flavobacteriales bacterium]|nr:amidohydrolase family protein [Flavobacteriales bacterium]